MYDNLSNKNIFDYITETTYKPLEPYYNEIIMSNVYTGENSDNQKYFMIKDNFNKLTPLIIENIKKVNQLNHPCLLSFESLSKYNQDTFIIYEYCNGIRLNEYILNSIPNGFKRLLLLKQFIDLLTLLYNNHIKLFDFKDDFMFLERLDSGKLKVFYSSGMITTSKKIIDNNIDESIEMIESEYFTWVLSFIGSLVKYNDVKNDFTHHFPRFFMEFEDESRKMISSLFGKLINKIQYNTDYSISGFFDEFNTIYTKINKEDNNTTSEKTSYEKSLGRGKNKPTNKIPGTGVLFSTSVNTAINSNMMNDNTSGLKVPNIVTGNISTMMPSMSNNMPKTNKTNLDPVSQSLKDDAAKKNNKVNGKKNNTPPIINQITMNNNINSNKGERPNSQNVNPIGVNNTLPPKMNIQSNIPLSLPVQALLANVPPEILAPYQNQLQYLNAITPMLMSNPMALFMPKPMSNPMGNPISNPMGNPISNPMSNPMANPMSNPISNQMPNPMFNPMPNPMINPISNPMMNPLINPMLNPMMNSMPNPLLNKMQNPTSNPSSLQMLNQIQSEKSNSNLKEIIKENEAEIQLKYDSFYKLYQTIQQSHKEFKDQVQNSSNNNNYNSKNK